LETGNTTILKEISREEFLHDDYEGEPNYDTTVDVWTDDEEISNKLGDVSDVDDGNITSHSRTDDPVPFFRKLWHNLLTDVDDINCWHFNFAINPFQSVSESLLSGAAEAHQQKLNRTNKILSRENFNETKNSNTKPMDITDQPMVKMDEARVLKSSKLTFMVILIVWLILTVIVIGKCVTPISYARLKLIWISNWRMIHEFWKHLILGLIGIRCLNEILAAALLIKLFCNCEIFKLICCDKLGNRPIMT